MSNPQSTSIHHLPNGLTVIVEEMPHVQSTAYDLSIPGGVISDSPDTIGASLILAELTSRGAGDLDSRALSDAFERCGIRHGESSGHDNFHYAGMMLKDHLEEGLRLVALMVTKPSLPEAEVDKIKDVALQDLASLVDNPARRAMVELMKRYYPEPYGRSSMGTEAGLKAASVHVAKSEWGKKFRPKGSVLSVAGNCNVAQVLAIAEKYFGAWQGQACEVPKFGALPAHHNNHISYDSAQLQIALAFPSAPFGHKQYYATKIAIGMLSGGMFGRLFIEVREKRGLCYSVYAKHSATKDYGTVVAYAGTTPERAQETLDVMMAELGRLKGTGEEGELSRAKANLKAAIIIGEESSAARAQSNAHDWWLDKRVRSLNEILSEIDKVTLKQIDSALQEFEPKSFTLVTLGSRELAAGGVR